MSEIKVKQIEDRKEWDGFIDTFAPHTFLQTWEWNLSQQLMGSKTFPLGIYAGEKLVGVSFVYLIKAKRGAFIFCPHGPIISENFEQNFQALFVYLKDLAKKERADFIRISPLEIKRPESILLFRKFGFRDAPIHMHPELAWILDVSKMEQELLSGMKKRTRYSIAKAQKDGVEILASTNTEDVKDFYDIYLETASRQDFVPFSKKYIKEEFEIFGKENKIVLFFAKHGGETIATAMIIFSNGSGFYHHGASVRNNKSITASELLQWSAILECKKRGFNLYNFWGIAPEDAKNHPWVGLSRFKRGFGGFSEEYVHAQDYPMTLKYWLNYIIETIRRIKRKY